MQDLATGLPISIAQMITNDGRIAGIGRTTDDGDVHVFQWSNGVTTDLGAFAGSNSQVTVTGLRTTALLAWRRNEMDRFESSIWRNGVKELIDGLYAPGNPGGEAQAAAMNDSRQVVGASLMPGFAVHDVYHPFIWENGVTRDLGVLQEFPCEEHPELSCGDGRARDINDRSQVVGISNDSTYQWHAVLWSEGSIHDLGLGVPLTINNAGDIAGNRNLSYGNVPGQAAAGYFWRTGTRTDIGSLGGATVVVAMNGQSTLVGTSLAPDGRPHVFVWKPGQSNPSDLGTGPGDTPGLGAMAVAINERGDVVGYTCDNFTTDGLCTGNPRAVLWRRKAAERLAGAFSLRR